MSILLSWIRYKWSYNFVMIIYLKVCISFVTKERPLVNRASSEESNEVRGFFERNMEYSNAPPGALEAVGRAVESMEAVPLIEQAKSRLHRERMWLQEFLVFEWRESCLHHQAYMHFFQMSYPRDDKQHSFFKLKFLLVPFAESHDVITAVWDLIIGRDVSLAKEDRVSWLGHYALFKLSFK